MMLDPIHNAHGERIAFTFVPGQSDRRDIVVIGHGLTSDKERPWSVGLSNALRERGIASLRISFSGNGESGGDFLDSTITKEVEDLGSVLDALPQWNVSYVGHSMGGAVGLLRAAKDQRIRNLVSLAAITHSAEFFQHMFGQLGLGVPLLGKAQCPLGQPLRADLLANQPTLEAARSITVPWLVVHGSSDVVVPVQHSIDLNAAANGQAEFVLLEGADHSFTQVGLGKLLETVIPWLADHNAIP
jgi:pimeloyl-ACP methyl ester carboxylesterase